MSQSSVDATRRPYVTEETTLAAYLKLELISGHIEISRRVYLADLSKCCS